MFLVMVMEVVMVIEVVIVVLVVVVVVNGNCHGRCGDSGFRGDRCGRCSFLLLSFDINGYYFIV